MILGKESEQDNIEVEGTDAEIDNEEINNSEELEEKKRQLNRINIEGNSAQKQLFIGDAGSGSFTINYYDTKMEPIMSKLPVDKRYDLRMQEECIEFVETFKDSEYFTTAVLLCVFEAVILTDLNDLRSKLDHYLKQNGVSNNESQEMQVQKENSFISLNSILAVIGANKFITENDKQCVSIGKNSVLALINMLEQFPVIQDLYENFLAEITQNSKYQTSFYESQLASSLAEICAAGVVDFQNRIYPRLCENMNNTYLLGDFVYKLYTKKEKESKYILGQCLFREKTWLWRVACYACTLFQSNDIHFPFEKELRDVLIRKVFGHRKEDFNFIAWMLIQSKCFRDLLCNVFSVAYMRADTRVKQRELAQSYLYLVRLSYYKVNFVFTKLPLVACDTKQQQEYLHDILEMIMSDYYLRKQLYAVLKAYLKEVAHYKFSKNLIRHLAAFCYNVSADNREYREDIKEMLLQCDSRVAKQVSDFL